MTMEPKKELKKRIRSSDPVARMASLYLAQLDGLTIEAFWNEIETLANREYKWGFVSDIEADAAPMGLNEEIVRFISHKKGISSSWSRSNCTCRKT